MSDSKRDDHAAVPPDTLKELAELVARLELDPAPRDEYEFEPEFSTLVRSLQAKGELPPPELVAEQIAFTLHAHDHQQPSVWALYFGPFMSGLSATGEPWESPPLSSITPDVLSVWRTRASACVHPVMRARYADLLWEMPKRLDGASPDPGMARVAIDSYLEAVRNGRYSDGVTSIAKAKRSLDLALSISDQARVIAARDAMLSLEDAVADDESIGLWGFCFDAFVEPPHKHIPLTKELRERLVAALDARLARLADRPPDLYHPMAAEAATLRLATHYRRLGRSEDVARVLRAYGEIVRRMRGTAAPLVTAHTVERLFDQFKSFGLHSDADALSDLIRTTGAESVADMKVISVEVEGPSREQVEAYYTTMLGGSAKEVLARIAVHFVPRRKVIEEQLRKLAQQAPLSYLMTHTVVDDEGRTIARVGSLDSDLEGHVVRHMSQNIHLSAPWLRESFSRALDAGKLSTDVLLEFLTASPIFQEARRPFLASGLDAYVRTDTMASVHILIPQAEQALRQIAVLINSPLYVQRRGGGLLVRTMDDLLRDNGIQQVLGDDIAAYLRVLFTDPRGWNVRNDVCHGLASVRMLTQQVADRVVHALLTLALVRESDEQASSASEVVK